jgi:uncharacterized membrane protein YoaK (UPF0700 family)
MLYGNESISTYTRSNVIIWMTLAFQGGFLNIGGFMACHRFVSHVTGFATFIGVDVSQKNYIDALSLLVVPFFFLFGAMMSGYLIDIRLKLKKKPKYYIVFGWLFFLLLVVVVCGFKGVFGTFGEPLHRFENYLVLGILCLVCGMQNGMITTVSKAVIRTTHLTGITTDLGLGLVRVLNRKKFLERYREDVRDTWMRLGIISFFGLGSIVGGLIFIRNGYQGFLLPFFIYGVLFSATYFFQVLKPRLRV